MAVNSAAIVVGRLLEVRLDRGYRTVADVDELFEALDAAVAKLPASQKLVTAADWRRCPVMESAAAEQVRKRIAAYNSRTERSAALASLGSPTAVLQFMRLIRESGLQDRKMFFNAEEQIEWLKEVLTPAETQRLREFLAEGGQVGSSPDSVVGDATRHAAVAARGVSGSGRR